jgi:hypothetical protein
MADDLTACAARAERRIGLARRPRSMVDNWTPIPYRIPYASGSVRF